MSMNVQMYRVASVPTEHIYGAIGLSSSGDSQEVASDKAEAELRKRFGPHLPPGVRIFWGSRRTVVGIEAMSFNLAEARVPMAGLVQADPVDPVAVHRMDGALESELKRWGIWTKPEDYEWRVAYEAK